MKVSCRNQISGTVAVINKGAVNSEVILNVSDEVSIASVITNQSVARLELAAGTEATALVKASDIMLADSTLRTSARNVFSGTVTAIAAGEVNDEITVAVGEAQFVAIITKASTQALELAEGQTTSVVIKASSVMLAV